MELDLQASLDAGLPATITMASFDTKPPANIDDKDLHEQSISLQKYPANLKTDTSLQRFLLQTAPMRLQILAHLNNAGLAPRQAPYDEVVMLSKGLAAYARDCGSHISARVASEIRAFQHNLADLLLRRFLLQLHRPSASQSRTGPQYYFSRKMSLDSGMAIISPIPQNKDFDNLCLVAAGLFKNRIVHASLAIANEVLMDIEENGLGPATDSSCSHFTYRKMLFESLNQALRQSAERIRLGETNARLHMKLSMVLEQVKLTNEASSSMQRLVQSAKNSLEMTYAVIHDRAIALRADVDTADGAATFAASSPDNFDSESFNLGNDFSLDDIFLLPADFGMEDPGLGLAS
jgi:hypothetical protein